MVKLTTINILGYPNDILNLKRGYDKTLKNIPNVSDNLLRIAWKCLKFAQIITATAGD